MEKSERSRRLSILGDKQANKQTEDYKMYYIPIKSTSASYLSSFLIAGSEDSIQNQLSTLIPIRIYGFDESGLLIFISDNIDQRQVLDIIRESKALHRIHELKVLGPF